MEGVMWKRAYAKGEGHVRIVAVRNLRHTSRWHVQVGWHDLDYKDATRYVWLLAQGIRFPMIKVVQGRNGRYVVTDGNHRLYAIRRLGLKRVPVIVYPVAD
jgi:hypothetical protein